MMLKKYDNKQVKVTDIDGQIFFGISLYEDKNTYGEEQDGLSIKTETGWVKLFESEIKVIEII